MSEHLFDTEQGKVVLVPDAEVQDRLSSGKFQVPMLKDGQLVGIAPDQQTLALQNGLSQPDPYKLEAFRKQNEQQVQEEAQYGNQPLAAGVEGLLSNFGGNQLQTLAQEHGIDFGLPAEERQKLLEHNRGVSTAGELVGGGMAVGLAGPLLSSAGEALGASGPLMEGLGLAAKAKEAATPTTLAAKLATLGGKLAKGGSIGAGFGALQAANEADLGETQLTSEKLWGGVGRGLATGVAVESGLIGLEAVLPKALTMLSNKLADLKDKLNISGQIEDAQATANSAAREAAPALNEFQGRLMDALTKANKEAFPEAIQSDLATFPVQKTMAGLENVLQKVSGRIAELEGTDGVQLSTIQSAGGLLNNLIDQVQEAQLSGEFKAADVFFPLREFKQEMSDLAKFTTKETPAQVTTISGIRDLWSEAQKALNSEDMFGAAGVRNAAWDAAQHGELTADRALRKLLGLPDEFSVGARRMIDEGKVRSAYDLIAANEPNSDRLQKTMIQYAGAGQDLQEAIENLYRDRPLAPPNMGELKQLWGRVQDAHLSGIDAVKTLGELQPSSAAGTVGGRLAGSLAGSMLGGVTGLPGGRLIGGAVGSALTGGARSLEALGSVAGMLEKVNRTITSGIEEFLGNPLGHTAREKVLGGVLAAAGGRYEAETDFEDRVKNIQKLVQNPEMMLNTLQQAVGTVLPVAAPNLSKGVQTTATKAIMHSAAHAPKPPAVRGILQKAYKPPRSATISSQRRHRAAFQPLSLIDDMVEHKLTNDAVDTVRFVTPALYSAITTEVVQQLTDNPDRQLSTPQKSQLSILLQEPVDSASSPAFIAMIQGNFEEDQGSQEQDQPAPQRQRGRQPTQGGLAKINIGQDSQTETQRLQSRRTA